jgi:hypothetical protein
MNSEVKTCQNCKTDFTIDSEDFNFYKKISVPPPTFCPECRYVRRLLDRNEYNFYKRKCDATGKDIISIYREDQPFPVYEQEYWKSDKFEARDYGRDFDFNRSFFDQFEELRRVVPHLALVNSNSVNSEYTNQSNNNKECYMLVTSDRCEKCMYGSWCGKSFFSSDCYMIWESEFCYESINLNKCSKCIWCQDCSDCVGLQFCIDCRGCLDCFGCVGLREKQYYWFNKQLTKEEYGKKLKTLSLDRNSIQEFKKKVQSLRLRIPTKYYHGVQIKDSTGDYIENMERARYAFNCKENKDTAYMQDAWHHTEDCRDCTEIINAELSYEIQGVETPHRTIVARSCFNTITDSYYCDMCFATQDCFGCFGLKKGKYCILNKQYTKKEYFGLKAKIIDHMKKTWEWGEYFPGNLSPFAYNESMAQDYFPLTKDEALKRGYSWYDRPPRDYKITKGVIQCATQNSSEKEKYPLCTTAFKTTPLELSLYEILKLPIPEKCFPCRRQDRFALRNPRRLWHRQCMCDKKHPHHQEKCEIEFETSYEPDRPEIVYCEKCYQSEVY